MNKWFRKKGRKSRKSRKSLTKPPKPPASRASRYEAFLPTNATFIEDVVRETERRSNATNEKSKFVGIQTQFSRLQRFLHFTEQSRHGEAIKGQVEVYEALLWASTRPDLLNTFVDTVVVMDEWTASTVLNCVNDIKKAMSWAIKNHRRLWGGIPYIYC